MENILIHGVCSLIGDFLGISPTLIEFSKNYNVFIDTISKIDSLVELLKPYRIERFKNDVIIHHHFHSHMDQAYLKSQHNGWYMTQAFMDDLGLPVPPLPPKANLVFPEIPVKQYDYLLSPFARSLVPEDKWQQGNWQQLIHELPNKKFALLGDSSHDDKNYVTGQNVDVVFDQPFSEVCNLFKSCTALISVVTGTSHLAFHLGVNNILLVNQNMTWGINPNAFCIKKPVTSIDVHNVVSFINYVEEYQKFDEEYYLITHPDVADFINKGGWIRRGYDHYVNYGKHENRKIRWKS
jgi:hypothetical protein